MRAKSAQSNAGELPTAQKSSGQRGTGQKKLLLPAVQDGQARTAKEITTTQKNPLSFGIGFLTNSYGGGIYTYIAPPHGASIPHRGDGGLAVLTEGQPR